MGIKASAGTLEVEILVDLIRLKQQMGAAQDAVGGASTMMAVRAQAAGKALSEIGGSSSAAFRKAERDGEGVSKMLARQIDQYGRSSAEIRDMKAAQAALNAEQRGMPDLATRIRAQVAEMQKLEGGAAQQRQLAADAKAAAAAASVAAAAERDQASALASLRASIDPARAGLERMAAELETTIRLYRSGAMEAKEYANTSTILAARLSDAKRAHQANNSSLGDTSRASKLASNDILNLGFQLNDMVVSLAGGQKPLTVFLQQGSQIGGIMAQTGAGIGDMAKAMLGLATVSTPTTQATNALAAAQDAVSQAQEAVGTASTLAEVATSALAVTNGTAAATAAEHAAAEAQLTAAQVAAAATAADEAAAMAALTLAERTASVTGAQMAIAQAELAAAELAAADAAAVATAAAARLAAANEAAAAATAAAAASATRSLAPWAAALIIVGSAISVAGVAFHRWQEQMDDDAGLKKYAEGLGLTHKEMKKLGDVSVTTGDMLGGIWDTLQDRMNIKIDGKKIMDYFYSPGDAQQVGNFIAQIYGLFVGGYKGIKETWSLLPAALSDIFTRAVNAAAGAIEAMVNKSIEAVNSLARGANSLLGSDVFGQIGQVQIARLSNEYAGAGEKAGAAFSKNIQAETKSAMGWMKGFIADSGDAAVDRARKRTAKAASEIIADRTPKTDKHAEQLAREAEAMEAQIRNLYKLADAYRVSDAAALIAEARVKAESQAIKQRGDVEIFVARQVRLAVAERIKTAAEAAAGMRFEADAQAEINRQVEAGLMPASRADEALRQLIALRPLQAAAAAAAQVKDVEAAAAAKFAIDEQAASQARLNAEKAKGQFNVATAAGSDQLAMLREELRLVGATDAARARALVTLKATQEAEKFNPADRAAYVKQQQDIADAQEKIAQATKLNNDLWERQAKALERVQDSARNMAEAFGRVGGAIGDVMVVLADYGAKQKEIDRQVAEGERTKTQGARESADLQLNSMIGLTSAAKGLFNEHSKGYKAMVAAEKVLTVVQLARTAVDVAGGAARMFATMGPLGFAGVGAMLAVMAGLGFSGGGSGGSLPKSNTGTGTTLGDDEAKSASLERAIERLRDVDLVTMNTSREMLASLRKIEANIGGLASLLVRTGNIDASAGVNTGFKTDTTGNLLKGVIDPFGLTKSIPILGDLIGGIKGVIGSLFGTKTSIVANGLFGGPQAIADVLNAGFDASYFSDVKKTKKFFGVSTGSKYSTQYSDASGEIEQQFGLILTSFYQTIAAAAPALGQATSEIEARLAGFVVDIGRIDLKDLTGEEIQEKLQAVFGAAADEMARAAFPGMERFQQVGEGMFETLVRVATTVETVSTSLGRLGANAQGLGIDASMALAGMFDSVSDLSSAAGSYFETFYSEAEQTAIRTAEMGRAFASIGQTMPDTIAGFRALVEAQDLNTDAGRSAYAILLQLAPAFADLQQSMGGLSSAADILRERQDLERQLLEVQGDTAAMRADDLSKLDASNRALQAHIWALQDQAVATQAAAAAAEQAAQAETARVETIANERAGLQRQLLDAQGDTNAIRQLELAGLDASNRAIQMQIWALNDQAVATAAAAQAAQEAAASEQALASARDGLERQIMSLTGDTAGIRARELAALDPSLRALQERIYAIQDEQAANAAAQQAADEATRAAEQLADAWRSISDSLMDEVRRIRGEGLTGSASYADLLGQFNAATAAARMGDQDAAKSLPGLSKAMLDAAALVATSRQELDRVQGVTAASLEETARMLGWVTQAIAQGPAVQSGNMPAAWASPSMPVPSNEGGAADEIRALRRENADTREMLQSALAQIASKGERTAKVLERSQAAGGGDALATVAA